MQKKSFASGLLIFRGNPALFKHPLYCRLMALQGDIGARDIIKADFERVLFIKVNNPLSYLDVDTPEVF